jgi:serpin B
MSVEMHPSGITEKRENTFKRILQASFNPITSFGATFFSRLCSAKDGNLVMSPLSLWTALAMTEMATTEGCSAKSQLRDVLHYHLVHVIDESPCYPRQEIIYEWIQHILRIINVNSGGVQLSTANAIFCDGTIRDNYEESCQEFFDASVIRSLQMQRINEFVAEKTNKKIEKIVSQDADGPAVLVSAAYFAADWSLPFQDSLSYASYFTSFDLSTQECTMMVLRDRYMMYKENLNMKVVKLPYGRLGNLTASIVLPKQTGEQAMREVVQQLFRDSSSWEAGMRGAQPRDVHLELPKFEAKGDLDDIKTTMQTMKVVDVFEPGYLGSMTTDMTTRVGQISHKAAITVDEKGTTAAAVTVVETTRGISRFETVRVDRPFLFVVTHVDTSTLVFVARVTSMKP